MIEHVAIALLWLMVLWRLPCTRRSPIKRSLWWALVWLALALTAHLPSSIAAFDHFAGIANLSGLIFYSMGICSGAAMLDWVSAMSPAARAHAMLRFRRPLAAASITLLATLFVVAPRAEAREFVVAAEGDKAAILAVGIFEVYFGYAMIAASRMLWTARGKAASRCLSTGVWLMLAGTLSNSLFAVGRCALFAAWLVGLRVPGGNNLALVDTRAPLILAVLLMVLGISVPTIEAGLHGLAKLRALLALRPLWSELTTSAPGVVLGTPPTLLHDLGGTRYLSIRLLRRTIEIRDAALLLRGHVSCQDWQEIRSRLAAAGLRDDDFEAAAQAVWIGLGLQARKRGATPHEGPAHLPPHGAAELTDEARWLRRVAAARKSPVVRDALAALGNQADRAPLTPIGSPLH
ncbi:MAB_1171c family putative transporter [Streptacidiphilus albus]|uniref:MAB_1171c family putative transporter n=1 Tax=Streptacidiphilus albus TaxID=105425 RepID=UPI00054BB2B1|nr:MAB_1171c family putative transporter [Streptacidiphilus albus]